MKPKSYQIKRYKASGEYGVKWCPEPNFSHFIRVSLHSAICVEALLKELGYKIDTSES